MLEPFDNKDQPRGTGRRQEREPEEAEFAAIRQAVSGDGTPAGTFPGPADHEGSATTGTVTKQGGSSAITGPDRRVDGEIRRRRDEPYLQALAVGERLLKYDLFTKQQATDVIKGLATREGRTELVDYLKLFERYEKIIEGLKKKNIAQSDQNMLDRMLASSKTLLEQSFLEKDIDQRTRLRGRLEATLEHCNMLLNESPSSQKTTTLPTGQQKTTGMSDISIAVRHTEQKPQTQEIPNMFTVGEEYTLPNETTGEPTLWRIDSIKSTGEVTLVQIKGDNPGEKQEVSEPLLQFRLRKARPLKTSQKEQGSEPHTPELTPRVFIEQVINETFRVGDKYALAKDEDTALSNPSGWEIVAVEGGEVTLRQIVGDEVGKEISMSRADFAARLRELRNMYRGLHRSEGRPSEKNRAPRPEQKPQARLVSKQEEGSVQTREEADRQFISAPPIQEALATILQKGETITMASLGRKGVRSPGKVLTILRRLGILEDTTTHA